MILQTPFLRWAGGKSWLVNKIILKHKNFNAYYEPFLGAGAVFCMLKNNDFKCDQYFLSDLNPRLIGTYLAIRDNSNKVLEYLKEYKNNEKEYYEIRSSTYKGKYQRASAFIYLNRTCFNGLYRENLKGEFNVPYGHKDFSLEDLSLQMSIWEGNLKDVNIKCCDFTNTLNLAKSGDFAFIDPPYTVAHENNGFIKYNQSLFSWEDQIRLKNVVTKLNSKGVKFLLTNAYHSSIIKLYSDFERKIKVHRASVIGVLASRKNTSELIVTNFSESEIEIIGGEMI